MTLAVSIIILSFSATLAWLWSGGIDYMMKTYPKYKGEDFLNWGGEDDEWDDDKVHTEGEFMN